jgi:predicted transcriptional regulator
MIKFSDSFIQKTIKTWQPYFSKKLSKKDAIEITENITRFFDLLLEIDNREKK